MDGQMTLAKCAELLDHPPGEGPGWYLRRDMAATVRAASKMLAWVAEMSKEYLHGKRCDCLSCYHHRNCIAEISRLIGESK